MSRIPAHRFTPLRLNADARGGSGRTFAPGAAMQVAQATKTAFLYGVGNFGFALLKHLGEQLPSDAWRIRAFDRNAEVRAGLNADRHHPWHHSGTCISHEIAVEPNIDAIRDADLLILAVESNATREVLASIAPRLARPIAVLNTAKALDHETGQPLSSVVQETLGSKLASYALLAGGTIASDLIGAEPLGASLACANAEMRSELQQLLQSPRLFIYPTDDLVGVECASAFKSVVAIGAGIASGAGLSHGAQTYTISRLAAEVEELAVSRLGAQPATFTIGSQAWGNDMWLSCTGNTRNREFGILLGRGLTLAKAIEVMTEGRKTVEGVNTIKALGRVGDLDQYPRLSALFDFVAGCTDLPTFNSQLLVNQTR
ncbi:MAG: hypothetical protein CMJ85_04365 [Planctomycetes bacterium]|nr:hypothetical protein [Planctomycetota bacterium]MDP6424771.1 NAD(P)-binding domain-containing protein [Planctomycetota bacterium]